jgi:membrane protein implicated in regulation of membrane protease activity
MDSTLTYALVAGVALVMLAVIVKAALRWIFKVFAVLFVLTALAVGIWLWFNRSDRQPEHERTSAPTRRAAPARQ